MKVNPNCTRPECPKEFPEAQNFCNICGEKLTSVVKSGDPFRKGAFPKGEAKTFASKETYFPDIEDVLQLPQEPFDPMKTFVSPQGTSFPSFPELEHHEAEDEIIDVPELGDLATIVAYPKFPEIKPLERPTEKPVSPQEAEVFQTPPIYQEPQKTIVDQEFQKTFVDRPYESPETAGEQETILEPVVEPYELSKAVSEQQPETIVEQPFESYTEPPETIVEPTYKPYEAPETLYEPSSSISEPKPVESKSSGVEGKTIFEQQVSTTPSYGVQDITRVEQPQVQTDFPPQPSPPPSFASSAQKNQTLATVSLVLGILSIILSIFGIGLIIGIPAIITGYMAKNKADSQSQIYGGRGLAILGIILGGVSLLLSLVVILIGGLGVALLLRG
jgi:hypothetical protein